MAAHSPSRVYGQSGHPEYKDLLLRSAGLEPHATSDRAKMVVLVADDPVRRAEL